MRAACAAISCTALWGVAGGAQERLQVLVVDSLRGGGLAGASVEFSGLPIRVVTDQDGRAELRAVPTGSHELVVRAPFLDSLFLGALRLAVSIQRGMNRVVVSTPSLRSYQRAVCGTSLDSLQAVLRGELIDEVNAPVRGVPVAALWNEVVLTRSGTTELLRASVDSTDANGWFTLCGVPLGSEFQVRAGDEVLGTEVLRILPSPDPVRRRDLRIAPAGAGARLIGQLRSTAGAPLQGSVELLVEGAAAVSTEAGGVFTLPRVPTRSAQVLVRAIGFTPRIVDLEAVAPETDIGDIVLEPTPRQLEGRLIEGRLVSREEFEFEERRKSGLGTHFDSTFLSRFPVVTANALAGNSRIVRAGRSSGPGEVVLVRKDVGDCFPRVFLDGVYQGVQGVNRGAGRPPILPAAAMADLLRRAKRIEVYTAQLAPVQYQDFDGCGAVLIWTK